MSEMNLIPKELRDMPATQDALDILKEKFQYFFDTFESVMPKSPYPGKGTDVGDTFTKLMGANLIYTAFMEVYKDYVAKANLGGFEK